MKKLRMVRNSNGEVVTAAVISDGEEDFDDNELELRTDEYQEEVDVSDDALSDIDAFLKKYSKSKKKPQKS